MAARSWQTLAMNQLKWFDRSQPQTLQSAVLLSYLNAALALFYAVLSFGSSSFLLLVLLGCAVGAIGIANEKRWGYWLCAICACAYLGLWLLVIVALRTLSFGIILNVLFAVLLVVLLFHPQSREYRKIWFR
jgi:hypothetical protein